MEIKEENQKRTGGPKSVFRLRESSKGSLPTLCPGCDVPSEKGESDIGEDVYWGRVHSTSFQCLPASPLGSLLHLDSGRWPRATHLQW